MKIFFNSSMPRSGSTLLQNIVGQRNDFYVSPTSGVLELLYGARSNFSVSPEFKAQPYEITSKAFKSFCKGGLENYYQSITDKNYVLDKSRGWAVNFNFLNDFYPNPKIVCMVRDLRSILASYEKIIQNNSLMDSNLIKNSTLEGTTLLKRINNFLNKPPIGLALNRINDILSQPFYKNILFIKYEDLCKSPLNCLENLYKFFEIDNFSFHDFNNITQVTSEDDEIYGLRNLHTIKTELKTSQTNYIEILGEEISNSVYDNFMWYFNFFNYER